MVTLITPRYKYLLGTIKDESSHMHSTRPVKYVVKIQLHARNEKLKAPWLLKWKWTLSMIKLARKSKNCLLDFPGDKSYFLIACLLKSINL